MQDKTSLIEIINLLDNLEKTIKTNINKYNYYIDVLIDRFPFLEKDSQFKKLDIMEVHNEREKHK